MKGREKIAALFAEGPVTFERFMEAALYDAECGYYTTHIRTVGRSGDFSTSATLHSLLGTAIANWVKSLQAGKPLHLIEIGAGSGALAKSVLSSLGFPGRFRTHYHIVELSPVLKNQQRETLKKYRIQWHETMREALESCAGNAQIFSNELVDAFPCRVLVKKNGGWKELALELRDATLLEILQPLAMEEMAPDAESFPEGQRIEIQSSYHAWMKSWIGAWKRGNMLTIDYGERFPTLYHRRPHGTVRGYFHHQKMEGMAVYQNFGRQDITADANFTLLQQWGEEMKLRTISLCNQRTFLSQMLDGKKIARSPDAPVAYLLQEPGPGDAFQVLHQSISS